MRTTVEMPDPLFRRAKATASLRGVTLRDLVTQAVEHEISAGELGLLRGGHPVQLPLVPSLRAGKRKLTPEKVAQFLEKEDLRAFARH